MYHWEYFIFTRIIYSSILMHRGMKINKSKFFLKKRNFFDPKVTDRKKKEIDLSLDRLVALLGDDSEWYLAGSLAISTNIGYVHRNPSDIDIIIEKTHLFDAVRNAENHNYGLYSRIFVTKITPHTVLYVFKPVSLEEANNGNAKHLKLLKKNYEFYSEKLLSFIDIFLYEKHKNKINFIEYNLSVDFHKLRIQKYKTINGKNLNVLGLEFIKELKQAGTKEKDIYDLKIISEYI